MHYETCRPANASNLVSTSLCCHFWQVSNVADFNYNDLLISQLRYNQCSLQRELSNDYALPPWVFYILKTPCRMWNAPKKTEVD